MTPAMTSARNIPFCPPKSRPMDISNNVSRGQQERGLECVSHNLLDAISLDDTWSGAMQVPVLGKRPGGYPPPPPVYWNHRVSAKSAENLWRSTGYGQNLAK